MGCFIYSFHMPLFFFVSGYVYKHRDAKQLITSKVRYLLVPYFFGRLLIAPLTEGLSIMDKEYIVDVLFYGGNLWFTYVLFWTTISFWAVNEIINYFKTRFHLELKLGLLIVGIICIVIRISGILNIGIFAFNRMTYMIVFFIGGYYLSNYYSAYAERLGGGAKQQA